MFKENSKALAVIQYTPIALGIIMAFFGPGIFYHPTRIGKLSIIFFILGFSFFFGAKIINLKKGILFSIGTKGMSKYQRMAYLTGYTLMVTGFVFTLLFPKSFEFVK